MQPKQPARLVVGRNTLAILEVDNCPLFSYDVRNGNFHQVLTRWKSDYEVKFPEDGSYGEFFQLFKAYLCPSL